jgi:multisite-specific tRNA:(cytosine-C5)-methyltransferase
MRIYPHLQDTGGFFVAVLQKKTATNEGDAEVMDLMSVFISLFMDLTLKQDCRRYRKREAGPPMDEPELKKPRLDNDEDVVIERKAEEPAISAPQQTASKGKKAKGDSGFKEHPYTYLASDDPILESCMYVCSSRYDA